MKQYSSTASAPKKGKKPPTSIEAALMAFTCEQVLLLARDSMDRFKCPITLANSIYWMAHRDISRRTVRKAVDGLAASGLVALIVDKDGSLRIWPSNSTEGK